MIIILGKGINPSEQGGKKNPQEKTFSTNESDSAKERRSKHFAYREDKNQKVFAEKEGRRSSRCEGFSPSIRSKKDQHSTDKGYRNVISGKMQKMATSARASSGRTISGKKMISGSAIRQSFTGK